MTPNNPRPSPLEKMAERPSPDLERLTAEAAVKIYCRDGLSAAIDRDQAEFCILKALKSAVASSEAEIERLKVERNRAGMLVRRELLPKLTVLSEDLKAARMQSDIYANEARALAGQLQSARHQIEELNRHHESVLKNATNSLNVCEATIAKLQSEIRTLKGQTL